ncbi:hypothetical protein GLYMA_07G199450v4 [Glycine max]|nr:hypothetical protein GLYMA_07G199450v4 [Glycine max]KAH1087690.1 hypothetical protein GYH30_018989 [Glycine max]
MPSLPHSTCALTHWLSKVSLVPCCVAIVCHHRHRGKNPLFCYFSFIDIGGVGDRLQGRSTTELDE